jgi:hypothetical protein
MKKLLILFLISILAGCVAPMNKVLDVPIIEEDVCAEDCVTDRAELQDIFIEFNRRLEIIKNEIAPERNSLDIKVFDANTIYDRNEIITSDPITENYDILSYLPSMDFSYVLGRAYDIYRFCTIGEPCENPMFPPSLDLMEFNYGFNSSGGFTTYTLGSLEIETKKTSIRFKIDENQVWYEMIEYDLEGANFEYLVFSDGIYQKYKYSSEDIYSFYYIDTATNENFIYHSSETRNRTFNYNPDNQYSYEKESSGIFTVKKMDGMELIVQLEKDDDVYTISLNFNWVEGWNQFLSNQISRPYNAILYNNGDEVFTDYIFYKHSPSLRYTLLIGKVILSESELQNYTFPDGFSYEVSVNELQQEMTVLEDKQYPYDTFGFSEEDILKKIKELQAKFIG